MRRAEKGEHETDRAALGPQDIEQVPFIEGHLSCMLPAMSFLWDDVDRVLPELQQYLGLSGGGSHEWVWAGSYRRKARLVDSLYLVVNTFNTGLSEGTQGPVPVAEGYLPLFVRRAYPMQWGGTLMLLTGPEDLIKAQKSLAQQRGYDLSYRGLHDRTSGKQLDDGTERSIYDILHMPWLEPEEREAFASNKGPQEMVERDVPSSKDATKLYQVKLRGNWAQCTCAGWTHRRSCRHVSEMREEFGLQGPVSV